MVKEPLVSIVIPTYNRKYLVSNLIKSLLNGTYKNIEIIVVDDASNDNTSLHLEKLFGKNNKVKLLRNKKNLFAAGSKNVGQKSANGKYLAFIDDDNRADPRMLEELISFLEKESTAGQVGPVNYVLGRKNKILLTCSTRNMWTTKTLHLRTLAGLSGKDYWQADDVPNAFVVRRDIIEKNNIRFRPRFGIMYEESDYAYRIRRAGYQVYYVKKAKIFHETNEKDKDFIYHFMTDPRRPFVFARNRVVFHALYSSKIQNFGIFLFWIWFFTIYYSYKFIGFKDDTMSIDYKLGVALSYLKGTLNGLYIVISGGITNFIVS